MQTGCTRPAVQINNCTTLDDKDLRPRVNVGATQTVWLLKTNLGQVPMDGIGNGYSTACLVRLERWLRGCAP